MLGGVSFILLASLLGSTCAVPVWVDVSFARCGYDSCPKGDPGKLNVHLVAHSHDDVGWLKTVDQYFYGLREEIQKAKVQDILDTAVEALKLDPKRKFIYVETAFLWKWWQLQDEKARREVKNLIEEGRLEIIGGAWSMNDEATTHYQSIVDQFTWGFRRLNDTFGECARPKIGWQIDPFGHSREQASLFAQFGFDGMFIGRLDWEDKENRLNKKTTEFVWKASPNLGKEADLFSVMLYNNYGPPPGFCFDKYCNDRPINDDANGAANNVKSRIDAFYTYVMKQANYYQTNNIILTMGGDFHYQAAEKWYTNMDKLIKYTNELHGNDVNVFYSTPSCYVKSVHEAKKTWPTKSDDFFPYSSNSQAFWTGYFTSRPTLKYFERLGNNFLQIVKQLSVLSTAGDSEDLQFFREVMGVMQHHDAITGTEKQHVAEDYAKWLHEAVARGGEVTSKAVAKLSSRNQALKEQPVFKSCLLLNISSCDVTEDSKTFVVTLYNPRSHPASTYVRLPVQGKAYVVRDLTGTEVITQLVPIPTPVTKIPGRSSTATRELVFRAPELPPLGYQSFFVTEKDADADEVSQENASSIGNDLYDISVNEAGNVVIQWKNEDLKVVQSLQYYEGGTGNLASGAYLFRPKALKSFAYSGSYKTYKGPLTEEIHLVINEWVSEVVRIYKTEERIEFDWVVGPIPVDDRVPKEIVTKYTSNLASNGVFHTDSNGREMLKRVRNFRPTWDLHLREPISGNYYPITTKISLEDEKRKLRMSVLTDRAQGGTSMNDGELEVMLHRRLLHDDSLGVGEALNEQAFGTGLVARGTHYLVGNSLKDLDLAVGVEKSLVMSLLLRPWLLFTPAEEFSFDQWSSTYTMLMRGLRAKLPPNVHLLTLEPWKNGQVLLRLEHLFEAHEAEKLSQPLQVDLANLFADFDVAEIQETTLGGNQYIQNKTRLQWLTHDNDGSKKTQGKSKILNVGAEETKVILNPMEIRTFIVSLKS